MRKKNTFPNNLLSFDSIADWTLPIRNIIGFHSLKNLFILFELFYE